MFQLLKNSEINSSAKISQKIRFRLSIPGKWTSFDRNRKDPVFCLNISLCSRNFSTIFFSLNSKNEIILGPVFEKIKNFGK